MSTEPGKLKRYILTGTPGSGKTAIIRALEVDGFSVVEESATDVIALKQAQGFDEPWASPCFIDDIASLQRARLERSSFSPAEVQFHDRSIFCTAALADYLGHPRSLVLTQELEDAVSQGWFQLQVFFIRSLGFVTPSAARRISLEDAARFERVHQEVYQDFGFQLISVDPASPSDRANRINAFLREG
jgi:predicted ATPase